MHVVEIHLPPSELPRQMAAMRVWLDQHRFEPSSFACRDSEGRVLVCLEFKLACQASAFAEHFGGRAGRGLIARSEEEPIVVLETGLSAAGMVG